MAKFHGRVGFLVPIDDQVTGIAGNRVIEKPFYGKIVSHKRDWQRSDMVTDDLRLDNQIVIVGNDFAFKFATAIKYCEFMGGFWNVTGISIKVPEITLTLGGVYNGERPTGAPGTVARACSEGMVQASSGQQIVLPVHPVQVK